MQVERVSSPQGLNKSGKRVRNTLVTYPKDANNLPKGGLIRDVLGRLLRLSKTPVLWEGPMPYQLVGSVKDYQGYDG